MGQLEVYHMSKYLQWTVSGTNTYYIVLCNLFAHVIVNDVIWTQIHFHIPNEGGCRPDSGSRTAGSSFSVTLQP